MSDTTAWFVDLHAPSPQRQGVLVSILVVHSDSDPRHRHTQVYLFNTNKSRFFRDRNRGGRSCVYWQAYPFADTDTARILISVTDICLIVSYQESKFLSVTCVRSFAEAVTVSTDKPILVTDTDTAPVQIPVVDMPSCLYAYQKNTFLSVTAFARLRRP